MLDMFDNVRIRSTPLTERLGFAGLVGQVYGDTTPSVTAVTVIGDNASDRALNVVIPDKPQDLWFSIELVEFVDHAPGETMRVGNKSFVRLASGQWQPQ